MTVSIKSPTSTTGSIQLNGSDVLTIDSSGNLTVPNNLSVTGTAPIPASLSTASGSAPSYSARAWVNFNGTGTVAIRASGNVSSITDNGVGDYTINFTTAMPDTNYNVVASTSTAITIAVQGGVNLFYNKAGNVEVPPTTTAARIQPQSNGGTAIDPQYVCASIFR